MYILDCQLILHWVFIEFVQSGRHFMHTFDVLQMCY